MLVIVYKILAIFLMIAVGLIACKAKFIPFEANDYLIKLLINVLSPCMILTAITSKELSEGMMAATIEMMVCTALYFLIGAGLLLGVVRLLKYDNPNSGLMCFQMINKNTGFMGFPVTKATFGADGLYFMVLQNIVSNIYSFSIGLLQIHSSDEKKDNGVQKRSAREIIKPMINMCTICALLGVVMLFAGLKLPPLLSDVLTPIGDATIPVSMIVIGVQLADSKLTKIIKSKRTVILGIVSVTLVPVVTFLAVNWLPLYTMVKLTMVYASAFPTLVISVALAKMAGKDATMAAEFVSFTTCLSLVTLPLWTMFLSYWFGVSV